MSKSSTNLSDRIFFTIDWFDGTAYIGELEIKNGKQTKLVELSKDELQNLVKYLEYHAKDILWEEEE